MDLTKSVTDCPHPLVSLSLPFLFPFPPTERQSGPRLDRWVCRCIHDIGTLPGYKVHPMFDAGGDVRSDVPADRLTSIGSRARVVKADERVEMNSKNEA